MSDALNGPVGVPSGLPTVTICPGERTEIALPWAGKRGSGYEILKEAIGATRRGQVCYDKDRKTFSVARAHTDMLLNSLAASYGSVHVIQHGGQTKCVSACWAAKSESVAMCECSCAGANHGSGVSLDRTVSENGPAGELSVASTGPRRYDYTGHSDTATNTQ